MSDAPKPVLFSELLPQESADSPAPPVEPFEKAGFRVSSLTWNSRRPRVSRFPLPEHSRHNPLLNMFRDRYDFLKHIERGTSEFEKLLLMRQWIYLQVPTQNRNDSPMVDPFKILDRCAEGEAFVCTQYGALMQSCALAAGWTALSLHIDHDHEQDEPSTSHAVAEVWVNELAKWVVFDPMIDAHYEKDGVPLSAADVQREYIRNKGADVVPVVGVERRKVERARPNKNLKRGEASGYFWNKYVWGRNPFARNGSMEQDMQLSYITEAHEGKGWWQGRPPKNDIVNAIKRGALIQTRRLADINPDIGVCGLDIRSAERPGAVRVRVNVFLPAFEAILVSFNGGEYRPIEAEKEYESRFDFEWDLREGENRLGVRARNEFGIVGPSTEVIAAVTK